MPANKVVIDTNLLVLLIVGSVDEKKVGTKRTKEFTRQHYLGLLGFLENMDTVYVTPNVLTETSNLLRGLRDPRLMERLRRLVEQSREIPIESKIAVRNKKFPQVGLADAALLEVISAKKTAAHYRFRPVQHCLCQGGGSGLQLLALSRILVGKSGDLFGLA